MKEEIHEFVPAGDHRQREQTREEHGGCEAAQPLVQQKPVCKETTHEVEGCSQGVREGPELHTPSLHPNQTRDVLHPPHEGPGRTIEAEDIASEASRKAAATEEVEEIETA